MYHVSLLMTPVFAGRQCAYATSVLFKQNCHRWGLSLGGACQVVVRCNLGENLCLTETILLTFSQVQWCSSASQHLPCTHVGSLYMSPSPVYTSFPYLHRHLEVCCTPPRTQQVHFTMVVSVFTCKMNFR